MRRWLAILMTDLLMKFLTGTLASLLFSFWITVTIALIFKYCHDLFYFGLTLPAVAFILYTTALLLPTINSLHDSSYFTTLIISYDLLNCLVSSYCWTAIGGLIFVSLISYVLFVEIVLLFVFILMLFNGADIFCIYFGKILILFHELKFKWNFSLLNHFVMHFFL